MKQTSEPAVQPRRNLLTALGVWAVGLWTSTKLWAADPKCGQNHELGLVVARLCIDSNFRNAFFAEPDPDKAIKNTGMVSDTNDPVKDSLKKILKRTTTMQGVAQTAAATTSPNPIQVATENVGKELYAAGALQPCNPWPC